MTLIPCPFCGGEPHIERRGNARFSTIISCLDCGVTHECGDTGAGVGNGWNRRHLVGVPRWLIERAMESCKVNNDSKAGQDLIALLDPSAFPDRAAAVLAANHHF